MLLELEAQCLERHPGSRSLRHNALSVPTGFKDLEVQARSGSLSPRHSALSVRPMILKFEMQFLENLPVSHILHHDALSMQPLITDLEARLLERTKPPRASGAMP